VPRRAGPHRARAGLGPGRPFGILYVGISISFGHFTTKGLAKVCIRRKGAILPVTVTDFFFQNLCFILLKNTDFAFGLFGFAFAVAFYRET
jgi:hypothetical protein